MSNDYYIKIEIILAVGGRGEEQGEREGNGERKKQALTENI